MTVLSIIPVPDTDNHGFDGFEQSGVPRSRFGNDGSFLLLGQECQKPGFYITGFEKNDDLSHSQTRILEKITVLMKITVFDEKSLFLTKLLQTLLLTRAELTFPLRLKWEKPLNPRGTNKSERDQ